MGRTITIDSNAEYLAWPRLCVCCGGLDEIDVEVIVPDTSGDDHELSDIVTAQVPHCYDCVNHARIGFSWMQLLAITIVCVFAAPIVGVGILHMPPAILVVGGLAVVAVLAIWDRGRRRKAMRPGCASSGQAFAFVAPSSTTQTTLRLENDRFAAEFERLNSRWISR
ncbi:MAG TPA: hypothetical protein VGK19_10160 [Capsulimonadaceae bacterium]|jgi:hypothetical protein